MSGRSSGAADRPHATHGSSQLSSTTRCPGGLDPPRWSVPRPRAFTRRHGARSGLGEVHRLTPGPPAGHHAWPTRLVSAHLPGPRHGGVRGLPQGCRGRRAHLWPVYPPRRRWSCAATSWPRGWSGCWTSRCPARAELHLWLGRRARRVRAWPVRWPKLRSPRWMSAFPSEPGFGAPFPPGRAGGCPFCCPSTRRGASTRAVSWMHWACDVRLNNNRHPGNVTSDRVTLSQTESTCPATSTVWAAGVPRPPRWNRMASCRQGLPAGASSPVPDLRVLVGRTSPWATVAPLSRTSHCPQLAQPRAADRHGMRPADPAARPQASRTASFSKPNRSCFMLSGAATQTGSLLITPFKSKKKKHMK